MDLGNVLAPPYESSGRTSIYYAKISGRLVATFAKFLNFAKIEVVIMVLCLFAADRSCILSTHGQTGHF